MGKVRLVDLSHMVGPHSPAWPGSAAFKVDRWTYHAKDGAFTQSFTTHMHVGTHADSPIHVLPGVPYTHELPLESYYGTGVVVRIAKKKWEKIMPEDLEKARPKIEEGDIVIINSGMHKKYADHPDYFFYSPGLYKEAGEWFVEKKVKAVGVDQQAMDHPLGTVIGPHGVSGSWGGKGSGLRPDIIEEYERETGRKVKDDFPEWEPCHKILLSNGIMVWENVGGDLDEVTGMRVTIAGWPLKIDHGDGSMVRLVAIVDEGDQ